MHDTFGAPELSATFSVVFYLDRGVPLYRFFDNGYKDASVCFGKVA